MHKSGIEIQNAYREIEKCLKEIKSQVDKACMIADDAGVEFTFDLNKMLVQYSGKGSTEWISSDSCEFDDSHSETRTSSEWKFKLQEE